MPAPLGSTSSVPPSWSRILGGKRPQLTLPVIVRLESGRHPRLGRSSSVMVGAPPCTTSRAKARAPAPVGPSHQSPPHPGRAPRCPRPCGTGGGGGIPDVVPAPLGPLFPEADREPAGQTPQHAAHREITAGLQESLGRGQLSASRPSHDAQLTLPPEVFSSWRGARRVCQICFTGTGSFWHAYNRQWV